MTAAAAFAMKGPSPRIMAAVERGGNAQRLGEPCVDGLERWGITAFPTTNSWCRALAPGRAARGA